MKTITKPFKTWKFSFRCNGCGASLEADGNDLCVSKIPVDLPVKRIVDWFFVECPHCKSQKYVDASVVKIPEVVKNGAKKKK